VSTERGGIGFGCAHVVGAASSVFCMVCALGCRPCEAFEFSTTADLRGLEAFPCEVTVGHGDKMFQYVVSPPADVQTNGSSPSNREPLGQCGTIALGGYAGYTGDPSLVSVSVTPTDPELDSQRDANCMTLSAGSALGTALGFSGSGYSWSVDVSVSCGGTTAYSKASVPVCGGPQ